MQTAIVSISILLGLAFPARVFPEPQYVGEVIIVGNTYTPDRYVRVHVPLYAGQVLDLSQVQAAERELAKTQGWFLARPTVTVLESPGPYKDILIKVEERPGNWARLAAWEVALANSPMDWSRLFDPTNLLRLVLAHSTVDYTRLSNAADLIRLGVHELRKQ